MIFKGNYTISLSYWNTRHIMYFKSYCFPQIKMNLPVKNMLLFCRMLWEKLVSFVALILNWQCFILSFTLKLLEKHYSCQIMAILTSLCSNFGATWTFREKNSAAFMRLTSFSSVFSCQVMRWARQPSLILAVTLSIWYQMGRILWHCQNTNINEKLLGFGFLLEKDSECTVWTDTANLSQSWKGSSTEGKKLIPKNSCVKKHRHICGS